MLDEIQKNIENSYLFGCIKYKSEFSFYLMPVAYWILNHIKYDPNYNSYDWEFIFRDNILNVEDINIEPFIKAIQIDKIDVNFINMKEYSFFDVFLFFIDFDTKTFVSYFDDIDIEEYLPDKQWLGKYEEPMNYLPKNLIRKVFPNYVEGNKRSLI